MLQKRERLVPSINIGEFFALKITVGLRLIYILNTELKNDNLLSTDINFELDEVYKMIHYKLLKHDLKDLSKKYEELTDELKKLKPFTNIYVRTQEGRRRANIATNDFKRYMDIIKEKEMIIYQCLDELGYLGSIEIKSRRLR